MKVRKKRDNDGFKIYEIAEEVKTKEESTFFVVFCDYYNCYFKQADS